MGRRILYLILLLVLFGGGYYAFQHYKDSKMEADGDVRCIGCMTPDQEASFRKENAGETPDGQSTVKSKRENASQESNNVSQSGGATMTYPAPISSTTAATTPSSTAFPASSPVNNLPVSDSQTSNAPNGLRFGGTGNFQWYRQGNLTWRVNTQTGSSCIVYATMEEWRKPIVMQHGCGRDS